MDAKPRSHERLVCTAIEDVELLRGRRAETIDQKSKIRARGRPQVVEEPRQEIVDDCVSGKQRPAADAGFAVDSHADRHFTVCELERRTPDGRKRAGCNRNADAASPAERMGGCFCDRCKVSA